LFESSLTNDEIKDEIKQYVKALESGYMDRIEEYRKR